MVHKRELTFVLLYLGNLDLRIRLRQTIETDLSYCKLKLIFGSKCKLNTIIDLKIHLKKNSLWNN